MKKLLSVQEFSKLSGIEKTTLRYWDEIGLFSPLIRDPANRYRSYSPDQIATVDFIVLLSKLNIPLKTIDIVRQNKTPERIVRLFEEHQKTLDIELRRLHESYAVIHERLRMIRYGMHVTCQDEEDFVPDFAVRYMPEGRFILGPCTDIHEDNQLLDALMAFRRQSNELRINLSFPVGGYYHSMGAFVDNPDAPSHFFSSDPNGNRKWPMGDYLTGYSRGAYGEYGDTPEKMRVYAIEQNLVLNGPVFQIYLHDEICLDDPSKYLVQFAVCCTKKSL